MARRSKANEIEIAKGILDEINNLATKLFNLQLNCECIEVIKTSEGRKKFVEVRTYATQVDKSQGFETHTDLKIISKK